MPPHKLLDRLPWYSLAMSAKVARLELCASVVCSGLFSAEAKKGGGLFPHDPVCRCRFQEYPAPPASRLPCRYSTGRASRPRSIPTSVSRRDPVDLSLGAGCKSPHIRKVS